MFGQSDDSHYDYDEDLLSSRKAWHKSSYAGYVDIYNRFNKISQEPLKLILVIYLHTIDFIHQMELKESLNWTAIALQ